jgi:DNA-binding NarL/FixJ family response regulator
MPELEPQIYVPLDVLLQTPYEKVEACLDIDRAAVLLGALSIGLETARDRELALVMPVLEYASMGYSNKQIAEQIDRSPQTVRSLSSQAIGELGGATITGVVAEAWKQGFLPIGHRDEQPAKKTLFVEYELNLLSLIAAGLTNDQIGAVTNQVSWQVNEDIQRLRKVLGANNRTHLVGRSFELGLLKVDYTPEAKFRRIKNQLRRAVDVFEEYAPWGHSEVIKNSLGIIRENTEASPTTQLILELEAKLDTPQSKVRIGRKLYGPSQPVPAIVNRISALTLQPAFAERATKRGLTVEYVENPVDRRGKLSPDSITAKRKREMKVLPVKERELTVQERLAGKVSHPRRK